MKARHVLLVASLLVLGGCASTPEVSLRYFAPRATTTLTVTQSIDCSADKKRLLVSHTPSPTTGYARDPARSFVLDTSALKSAWANTELTVEWTDDGRLKSINHTATGQGETIVKSVVELVASPLGGAPPQAAAAVCGKLAALNGGKPAAIIYEGSIDHGKSAGAQSVRLQPAPGSRAVFDALSPGLPNLTFEAGARPASEAMTTPKVTLAESAVARVTLTGTAATSLQLRVGSDVVWTGKAVVPTAETYEVPIPRPRPFGKQTFALALFESGAIQKLTYNADTGAAAAANAAKAAASFGTTSDQAAAAAMNAESDLIAASQRLANCQAKPADCK